MNLCIVVSFLYHRMNQFLQLFILIECTIEGSSNYECRPFADTYSSTTDERYAVNVVEQPMVNGIFFTY